MKTEITITPEQAAIVAALLKRLGSGGLLADVEEREAAAEVAIALGEADRIVIDTIERDADFES